MDLHPLLLSMQIATLATVLSTILGLAVGALLARKRFFARELVDALLTAPMVLPPTVLGYYVLVALGRRSFVGQAFEALTGTSIVFTRTGAVVAAVVGGFPIVVKSARAALEGVDPKYARAARTLGATAMRAFFTVQLPLAMRGILAAVMLAFARCLGDFGVTLMVAGDIPEETQTASLAIYDDIQGHHESEALALVLILSAIAIVILTTVNRLTSRRDAD